MGKMGSGSCVPQKPLLPELQRGPAPQGTHGALLPHILGQELGRAGTLCSLLPLDQLLLACPNSSRSKHLLSQGCVRAVGRSPFLHPRRAGQGLSQPCCACCALPTQPRRSKPALRPLDRLRKRNYLCLLHISGPDCQKWQAALGHTAGGGWSSPGGAQNPRPRPRSEQEGRAGAGGTHSECGDELLRNYRRFQCSLFFPEGFLIKNHQTFFLALCNG